ncbi:hypothetical protein [Streptomyces sp. CC219B]|uniref:hypothetical protein n=1 Tax=Streptomyces sp. CC219B TaxID=3044574 RepID=UPI0024A7A5BA|nr:hypothetical protein [Streptomyces sp. CC219B]
MSRMSPATRAELDAEITDFGEVLAGHAFVPRPTQDEALLGDYAAALDAYEKAKRVLDAARTEEEARSAVRRVLDAGREALARVDKYGERGAPRSTLCFFDPKHGPATARVPWVPPGGASRSVDVCAADAARLRKDRRKRDTRKPQQPERPKRNRRDGQRSRSDVVRLDSPGPQEFRHHWSPDAPAVLVLRAVSYGKPMSTTLREMRKGSGGFHGPRGLVLKARGEFSARLPVPAAGRPFGGSTYQVSGGGSGHGGPRSRTPYDAADFDVDRIPYWETWLEPISTCRTFRTSISGEGWDVVRYTGGRATAHVTHGGRRGGIVVNRLDNGFHPAQELFRAHRPAFGGAPVSLPAKPAWLAVWCDSPWTIEIGPERAGPTA